MKPNPALDEMLEAIDEEQIAKGLPILSVVIVPDEGGLGVVPITRKIIERHGLCRPGEGEAACIARLRDEAQAYAGSAG